MIKSYTKKPVVIQALQWTGGNLKEIITFTDGPPDVRSEHAGMQRQEDGHNKNPFRQLLNRLMRNEGGYSTTEIGQLKYALDGFYGSDRDPAESVPAPHSEPWYGHQFKEVRRGYWQCSCEKAIAEAVPSASKDSYPPLPNRYAYDDDGGEMFTADHMRAYVDADRAARKQGANND
jgi:hypothetical protein